jgi:hypothetical protein
MKEFMLDESSVHEFYRKILDDIEHRDVVNMDVYSMYRMQVPILENDTADAYFERLCAKYEKRTDEQKRQSRYELSGKKIYLEELVNGNSDFIKTNAQQLAEALLEYWFAYIALSDKHIIQQVLSQNGSSALQDISDMFQKLFKKLNFSKRIAEKIRRYVDGYNKTDLPYEIVADISAELLNKCINTVGFEYFDEAEINDLKQANEKSNLGLVLEQNENAKEKSVAELFKKKKKMRYLSSYRNYLLWYNRLKISFIFVCDIPNYDVAANEKLGSIIYGDR